MAIFSKNIATVKISDPALVKTKREAEGRKYDKGAIYCDVPEIGIEGAYSIYCRYGLSIPYLQVKVGWKLWVEPTIKGIDRWIYTGIADCGQDSSITPETTDGILLLLESGKIMKIGSTSATEPFTLGNKLKTWAEKVDDAIKMLLDWSMTGIAPGVAGGITPLVPVPTDYTTFGSDILSTKIKGE
jgi:hypothetical protein